MLDMCQTYGVPSQRLGQQDTKLGGSMHASSTGARWY